MPELRDVTPLRGRLFSSAALDTIAQVLRRRLKFPGHEPPGAQEGIASQVPLGSAATGTQPVDGPTVARNRRRVPTDAPLKVRIQGDDVALIAPTEHLGVLLDPPTAHALARSLTAAAEEIQA